GGWALTNETHAHTINRSSAVLLRFIFIAFLFSIIPLGWLTEPLSTASNNYRLRHQRNVVETLAGGILNRIQNRRRRAIHRQFTDPFRAGRAVSVRVLFKVNSNRRNV